MGRTRIKICGICSPEDGLYAAELGVDAIGLVFHPKSPRYISLEQAEVISRVLPPFVCKVALFFNNSAAEIQAVLQSVSVDLLQFHGTEPVEFCEQFNKPYIKAVPMLSELDVSDFARSYQTAKGFLLDATTAGEPGGTGVSFDWAKVPKQFEKPLILAGGLNADNVVASIQCSACYAVDVSSGVESAKGIKSRKKMKEFVERVKMADYEQDN